MTTKKVFFAFVSILLVAVFALPGPSLDASAGLFDSPVSPLPPPPPNDLFESAHLITALPFQHYVNTWGATLDSGEPIPSCAQWYDWDRTVWYAYTPEESGSVTGQTDAWFSAGLAAYIGDSMTGLSEIGCSAWSQPLTLGVEPDTTYYFQVGGFWSEGGELWFSLEVAPPPVADFGYYPDQPSEFDTIWFESWAWDPAGVDIESVLWDFGDGTTSDEGYTDHRYATEGDFTVTFTVTTFDGRTNTTTKEVQVRTHDVAIVKFGAPAAAKVGQTRALIVGVSNTRYPEQVEVRLYKGVPGGYDPYELVGSLTQHVPIRPANRTTDFRFSYTFTSEDADIGKVTFKAVAHLWDAQDALPADNEAISKPTKVNP